jgi:hypothetical protein
VKTKSSARSSKIPPAESVPAPELTPETPKLAPRRRAAVTGGKTASARTRSKATGAATQRGRASSPDKPPAPEAATSASPNGSPSRAFVTDEEIRTRAYFLYLEHGGQAGSDVDFWLVAERELRGSAKRE